MKDCESHVYQQEVSMHFYNPLPECWQVQASCSNTPDKDMRIEAQNRLSCTQILRIYFLEAPY